MKINKIVMQLISPLFIIAKYNLHDRNINIAFTNCYINAIVNVKANVLLIT